MRRAAGLIPGVKVRSGKSYDFVELTPGQAFLVDEGDVVATGEELEVNWDEIEPKWMIEEDADGNVDAFKRPTDGSVEAIGECHEDDLYRYRTLPKKLRQG